MILGAFERDSPENWETVKVPVKYWIYVGDDMLERTEDVDVFRGEEFDERAIRDQLPRDIEDYIIL